MFGCTKENTRKNIIKCFIHNSLSFSALLFVFLALPNFPSILHLVFSSLSSVFFFFFDTNRRVHEPADANEYKTIVRPASGNATNEREHIRVITHERCMRGQIYQKDKRDARSSSCRDEGARQIAEPVLEEGKQPMTI